MIKKVYICDSCGKEIVHPHEEKMKEFYIGCEIGICEVLPKFTTRTTKIHLCDECFHGLNNIKGEI